MTATEEEMLNVIRFAVEEDKRRVNNNSEEPLPYVALTLPLVPRPWAVADRIPRRNVTLISGEGGIGKSVVLMQLLGATVLGGLWLNTRPEQGPALYLTAEEDENEARSRMQAVAESLGSTRQKLEEHGLRILSFAGRDAVLAGPDRKGIIRPTPLFLRIREDALRLKPKVIAFDAAADVFAGKEIDRAQTRQFITLARGLAIDTDSAVILVAHPSLTGIASDTGLSGNTAWHNSVKARLYLKKASGDTGLRALEVKKNNYGPTTETILLRWQDGVYVTEFGSNDPNSTEQVLKRMEVEDKINELFLALLRRLADQGRNVSDKVSSSYAPTVFANEPEAKQSKTTKKAFADAMARLFKAKKIRVVPIGPASRMRSKIVETDSSIAPSNAQNDEQDVNKSSVGSQEPTSLETTKTSTSSNAPSNGLPTPSNGLPTGCVPAPPIPPTPVGSGQAGVGSPARSNGKEGKQEGNSAIADEPEMWT